jgi:type IV secretion system protein VirB9
MEAMIMKKRYSNVLPILVICAVLSFPFTGECSELWEAVSDDFKNAESRSDVPETANKEETPESEMVEIEYGGKLISVDVKDLILMTDEDGEGSHLELYDPSDYEDQFESASLYGVGGAGPNNGTNVQEITAREYEEEQRARQWADVIEDLTLREIDNKALELVKEFGEAKNAVPPITGVAGSVVITWSSYTPRVVCRPMYVTDVILQPGETVTGVHPGDPVRWSFVPSRSGAGDAEQTHVLIKPLTADISTNVIINTDRRTYQLDLMSSATDFMPSVSFAYPDDSIKEWESFLSNKKKERESAVELASGYTVNPEDLHMDYEVRGSDLLRWKPVRVWDDGVKTYIQFKKGATKKSVEAPILVVYEHKKEVLVNYRAMEDMYVVDKVFDKGALIVGTGAHQDRVVITRLKGK